MNGALLARHVAEHGASALGGAARAHVLAPHSGGGAVLVACANDDAHGAAGWGRAAFGGGGDGAGGGGGGGAGGADGPGGGAAETNLRALLRFFTGGEDAWSDIEADVLARHRIKTELTLRFERLRACKRSRGRRAALQLAHQLERRAGGGEHLARAGTPVDELIVLGDGVATVRGRAQPTHLQRPQQREGRQQRRIVGCTTWRHTAGSLSDHSTPTTEPAHHNHGCAGRRLARLRRRLGAGDVLGLDELLRLRLARREQQDLSLQSPFGARQQRIGAAFGQRRWRGWAARACAWAPESCARRRPCSIVAHTDVKGWRLSQRRWRAWRDGADVSAPGTSWHTFARSRRFRTCRADDPGHRAAHAPRALRPGQPVFSVGDWGDRFYVIEDGEAKCTSRQRRRPS